DRWMNEKSLPFLAAAIMSVSAHDPREAPRRHDLSAPADEATLDGLIDAAAQVDAASPGHLTLAYHCARLLVARGRGDDARTQLDALAADGAALSPGDRNRIRGLRAALATEPVEFLQLTQQVPVAVGYDDGSGPLSAPAEDIAAVGKVLFTDYAAAVLDEYYTPRMMLDALRSNVLDPGLQRRVALTAWTRAVL